jgi:hypothetical protein
MLGAGHDVGVSATQLPPADVHVTGPASTLASVPASCGVSTQHSSIESLHESLVIIASGGAQMSGIIRTHEPPRISHADAPASLAPASIAPASLVDGASSVPVSVAPPSVDVAASIARASARASDDAASIPASVPASTRGAGPGPEAQPAAQAASTAIVPTHRAMRER